MMTDIHSHDPELKPGLIKVLSLQIHPDTDLEKLLGTISVDVLVSAGVHPWHASEWSAANIPLLEAMLLHSRISFFGEIGLDKVCGVSYETQRLVLETQLKLAERIGKVVLIHNVGYHSELMALKNNFKDIPAWILHGFRGKALLAEHYLRNGFYLSFGSRYQIEAIRACPIERLFLESDESKTDLKLLYHQVAEDLGISVMELKTSITKNLEALRIK